MHPSIQKKYTGNKSWLCVPRDTGAYMEEKMRALELAKMVSEKHFSSFENDIMSFDALTQTGTLKDAFEEDCKIFIGGNPSYLRSILLDAYKSEKRWINPEHLKKTSVLPMEWNSCYERVDRKINYRITKNGDKHNLKVFVVNGNTVKVLSCRYWSWEYLTLLEKGITPISIEEMEKSEIFKMVKKYDFVKISQVEELPEEVRESSSEDVPGQNWHRPAYSERNILKRVDDNIAISIYYLWDRNENYNVPMEKINVFLKYGVNLETTYQAVINSMNEHHFKGFSHWEEWEGIESYSCSSCQFKYKMKDGREF